MILANSAAGDKHLTETMTGGGAIFDYGGDGWPDIYVVNGAAIPSLKKTGAKYHNHLYRNNHDGTFADVTAKAGVAGEGYSMGVAAELARAEAGRHAEQPRCDRSPRAHCDGGGRAVESRDDCGWLCVVERSHGPLWARSGAGGHARGNRMAIGKKQALGPIAANQILNVREPPE
jgi:hypothetical protein